MLIYWSDMEPQYPYFIKYPRGLEVEPLLGTSTLNSNVASLTTMEKRGFMVTTERFAGQ